MAFQCEYIASQVIILALIGLFAVVPALNGQKEIPRLPTNVKPVLYDVSLTPDLDNAKLAGYVIISSQIVQSTDVITLNSVNLEIKSTKVEVGANVIQSTFTQAAEDQTLNIKTTSALPIGDVTLKIEFTGILNDDNLGCYRAAETNAQGQVERYYLLTQFDTRYARRCFPCADEPAIKAQFDIMLTVKNDEIAISNMPVDTENKLDNGMKVIKFKRTPIMSTNLLSFAVGHFDHIDSKTKTNFPVRMYTLVGKAERGKFALDATTNAVSYFNEYFNVPLPLLELNSLATPAAFYPAMENFGFITYTEASVLDDPKNPSQDLQISIAIDTCHEVCHQWLGDLVSIEWWTYVWLNEGFAYFFKTLCADTLFHQYDIWTPFITDTFQVMLVEDSYPGNMPVEISFADPSEIDQLFQGGYENAYNKGASLLKMVHDYLGAETFRKGFNLYLKKHQLCIAVSDDIWTAMEEASSQPIKKIMSGWTKNAGIPLITIESSVQDPNNIRTLVISQTRFLIDPNDKDDKALWVVPMAFSKQTKPQEVCFTAILENQKSTISIKDVKPEEWVKLNPGMLPFYRVKYTDDMYKQLLPAIRDKVLPLVDRLKILDDLFVLAQNGRVSTVQVLDTIKIMQEEDDWVTWINMTTYFSGIYNLLLGFTPLDTFYNFGQTFTKSLANKIGYDIKPNEKYTVSQTRTNLLWLLFLFEDKTFADVAIKKFQDHVNGVSVIPESFRGVVYRTALAVNGRSAYDSLLKLYRSYIVAEEKYRVLRSFEGVKDSALVDDLLKFSLSDEVDSWGVTTILRAVSASKVGREKTWDFFKTNFDALFKIYADNNASFLSLINDVIKNFTKQEIIKDIETFLSDKKIDSNAETIQKAFISIRVNVAWLQRDGEALKKYFSPVYKPPVQLT